MSHYHKTTREVCLGDDTYTVTCAHIPYYRGIYEKGGLQVSPEEPETYEIYEISLDGTPLTGDEWNDVEEAIILKLLEEDGDYEQEEPERDFMEYTQND